MSLRLFNAAFVIMPGYEAKFTQPLLKRYVCPICLFAMRNPVQTECGHLFCHDCLELVLKGHHPICPLDKEEIRQEGTFPDNACRCEILELQVNCNFQNCPWVGTLRDLEVSRLIGNLGGIWYDYSAATSLRYLVDIAMLLPLGSQAKILYEYHYTALSLPLACSYMAVRKFHTDKPQLYVKLSKTIWSLQPKTVKYDQTQCRSIRDECFW